jgi:hypothetical protein
VDAYIQRPLHAFSTRVCPSVVTNRSVWLYAGRRLQAHDAKLGRRLLYAPLSYLAGAAVGGTAAVPLGGFEAARYSSHTATLPKCVGSPTRARTKTGVPAPKNRPSNPLPRRNLVRIMQYPEKPPRGGVGWLAPSVVTFPFLGASPHPAACRFAPSPKRADRPTRQTVIVPLAGLSPPRVGSREMSARELDTTTLGPRQPAVAFHTRLAKTPFVARNNPRRGRRQTQRRDLALPPLMRGTSAARSSCERRYECAHAPPGDACPGFRAEPGRCALDGLTAPSSQPLHRGAGVDG